MTIEKFTPAGWPGFSRLRPGDEVTLRRVDDSGAASDRGRYGEVVRFTSSRYDVAVVGFKVLPRVKPGDRFRQSTSSVVGEVLAVYGDLAWVKCDHLGNPVNVHLSELEKE